MRNYSLFFLVQLLLISCQKKSADLVDTSHIEVDFSVNRFEVDFFTADQSRFKSVKQKYPMLFPQTVPDSVWLLKIRSSEEQDLYQETQKVFKDFSAYRRELTDLFKHITFYDSTFKSPDVTTVLNRVDYAHRVIYADSLLLISLDVYLGKNHPFYSHYPSYIKENNTPQRMVVDVAKRIIDTKITTSNTRTFLSKMIQEGVKLYLLDLYLPLKEDALKIGYPKEKLEWALSNEEQIWRYFIENSLLYDTSVQLNQRFLDAAPFSKFYINEDRKSPGRIGQWIGWQIVRSFMDNNEASPRDLLSLNESEIFKKSRYKPRR